MDLERAQASQAMILWSLIGLAIILLAFIIFRIVSQYWQQKRLDTLATHDPPIKTAVELLKEIIDGVALPPLMLFKISQDSVIKLGYDLNQRKILEQKFLWFYRYFIVDSPCIFYFDSSTKMTFEQLIPVKISTQLKITKTII